MGFTLVELLVVIAMLMLLAGAVTSSVSKAQQRAKIAQATAEAQEMTNAIRAFEHFWGEKDLESKMQTMENEEANETNLKFILGDENGPNGEKLPVLYNASIKNGKILDPWGNPYRVTIQKGESFKQTAQTSSGNLISYVAFPNFNRRGADN
jgi:type II secretory pathway pseudopilin PulG